MTRATLLAESFFSAPRRELFAFHERPDAFRLLTPEWAGVEVLSTVSTLRPSDEIAAIRTGLGPMRFPAPLIRLAIGEAGAYASGGARARADRVQALGYRFFYDDLEPALKNLLGRP